MEEAGIRFFEFLGVSSLAEARKLDGEVLRKKTLEYGAFWGPVIDKQFVMGDAFKLFIENKRLRVPVLLGHTSSEFYSLPEVSNLNEFKEMAREKFGSDADSFLKLCNIQSDDFDEVIEKASVSTIEYAIRVAGQANSDSGAETPLYYYNFDPEIPGWDDPGTFHSADLWFFFETLAKCWRPFVGKHYDLARQMSNYLVNFISSGDPNGKDSTGEDMPKWEPYVSEQPFGMVFGDHAEFVREYPDAVMAFLVEQYFKRDE